MIEVTKLAYTYGKVSLTYPDFKVDAGELFSIIGKSGSGKTTLIHLMAGLRRLQQGQIKVGGEDINKLKNHELDRFRGQNIGLIFQKPHLLQTMSVHDNLLSGQFFAGMKQNSERINQVLGELDLLEKSSASPHELSQGEAQRVAIARAVLNKPSLIIADEPTSSLDDENCTRVLNMLIGEARQNKASLIVVTHDKRVKDQIANGINLDDQ